MLPQMFVLSLLIAKQKSQGSCPAAYRFARDKTELLELARDSLAKAVKRMKKYADKHRRALEFDVGDKVLLKLTPQIWKKVTNKRFHKGLVAKYDGPFEVVKRVGRVAYRLKLPDRLKIHPTFHVSFLIICRSSTECGFRMRPPFLLSNENNIFPGWTFEGTVMYVTADETISLPSNGHAVLLGEDGKINQTFITNADYMHYVLSFTISPGGQNCSASDVVVSSPDSNGVFSLKQHCGREVWQSYGHYLGSWDKGEPVNLVFQSQTAEFNSSPVCTPVIDKLLLKSMPKPVQDNGFEFGPEFLNNSTEGILIDQAPSPVQSPLLGWPVLGTVKYIDSNHFFVPQGNNSCVEDFVVEAQAGSTGQNFTLPSHGNGSAKKFSMKFKADTSVTPISFMSHTKSQTKDGILCGPVVDDVVLRNHGVKPYMQWKFLISLYLLAILNV